MEQERGGRLAVRAGHAGDLELLRRLAEEGVRGHRHGRPRVGDHELRHRYADVALDDERRGATLDRLAREVVPVGLRAGDGEEERPGRHRTGVVGEVLHCHGLLAEHGLRGERGDQALELHRCGRLQRLYGFDAASGEISRYWSPNVAMSAKAGAATTPPQIAPFGSSIETSTTSSGFFAGTTPTKDAT